MQKKKTSQIAGVSVWFRGLNLPPGCGSKLNHWGTAGFSPCFHLLRFRSLWVPIFDPQPPQATACPKDARVSSGFPWLVVLSPRVLTERLSMRNTEGVSLALFRYQPPLAAGSELEPLGGSRRKHDAKFRGHPCRFNVRWARKRRAVKIWEPKK